jgi:hypothetical protein
MFSRYFYQALSVKLGRWPGKGIALIPFLLLKPHDYFLLEKMPKKSTRAITRFISPRALMIWRRNLLKSHISAHLSHVTGDI